MKITYLSLVAMLILLVGCTSNYFDEPKIEANNEQLMNSRLLISINEEDKNSEANDSLISQAYYQRGEHRLSQGENEEAIEDFIVALSINKNIYAYMNIITLPEEYTPLIIGKLSNKATMMSNEVRWPYYIGKVYFHHGFYKEAAESFKKAFVLSNDEIYQSMMEDSLNLLKNGSFNSEE